MIDEIAAGTDPTEGAALACAVLDALHRKGAMTLVTTHLGALKLEAHRHAGYLNASVEFDPDDLKPTYRLLQGIPGASNALVIAERLGISGEIIEKARGFLNPLNQDSATTLSDLVTDLEQKHRKLEQELLQAESFRKATQATYERMELERQRLESEKR